MKMSRPLLIVLILVISLVGYTFWKDHQSDKDVAEKNARVPVASSGSHVSAPVATGASEAIADQSAASPEIVNLFASQTWVPPPPPPPPPPTPEEQKAAAARAKPVAPPIPFTVVSIWRESGVRYIGLAANGEKFIVCQACSLPGSVSPGATLLQYYRLERISERDITFTFVPLKQEQVLPIGESP